MIREILGQGGPLFREDTADSSGFVALPVLLWSVNRSKLLEF